MRCVADRRDTWRRGVTGRGSLRCRSQYALIPLTVASPNFVGSQAGRPESLSPHGLIVEWGPGSDWQW